MAIDLNDPKMDGYTPLQDFIDQDVDLSSRRIRDMPYGKVKEDVQLSVSTLDFGETGQTYESNSQVITITNVGYGPINIYGSTLEGEFTLKSTLPATLLAGESFAARMTFNPLTTGAKTGSIYFDTGDAAGDELVTLTGTGIMSAPEVAPETLEVFVLGTITASPEGVLATSSVQPADITALNLGSASQSAVEDFATAVQGAKADTALQDASAFATAAQGAKADTAVQPGALGTAAYTPAANYATALQGAKADTAVQPGDIVAAVVDATTNSFSADRATIAAMDPTIKAQAFLKEAGREGQFVWDGSNLSASVALDTAQGSYIAPGVGSGLATDGSVGAWLRVRKNGDLFKTSEFNDDIRVAMAVASASGGGTVEINKRGTLQLPAGGVIKPANVELVGLGSDVTTLGTANFDADTDYSDLAATYMGGRMIMTCADGNNYQMTELPSYTGTGIDVQQLDFGSAHGLVAGDEVCIFDGNSSSFSAYRTYYFRGERHYVMGVNGNSVFLSGRMLGTYTYGTGIRAYKVHKWGGKFGGFKLDCSDAIVDTIKWTAIKVFRAAGAEIDDIKIDKAYGTGIEFDQCMDLTPTRIIASGNMDNAALTDQYPILIANSTDVVVTDSIGRGTWTGGDIGGESVPGSTQNYRCGFRDSLVEATGASVAAGMHGNTQECFYDNCEINGSAALSGLHSKLDNCMIRQYRSTGTVMVYATEIVGGRHEVIDCNGFSSKNAGGASFGSFHLNTQSDAAAPVEYIIRGGNFVMNQETRPIYLDSASASYASSLRISNTHFEIAAVGAVGLVQTLSTGTATPEYLAIEGVTGVPVGTLLYSGAGYTPTYKRVQGEPVVLTQSSGTNVNLAGVDAVFLAYGTTGTIQTCTNAVIGKTYTFYSYGAGAVTIDRSAFYMNGSTNETLNTNDVVGMIGTGATALKQAWEMSNNG